MESEKDKLKREMAEAKTRLEFLEKQEVESVRNAVIKTLEEYTDEEKIAYFDKTYNSALSELVKMEEQGWIDDDNEHDAWESYIEILIKDKKGFWKYFNSFIN